jgi:ribonuclease HI
VTKYEILRSLSEHLDSERLLAEFPGLGRERLSHLLKEAAEKLGQVLVEPKTREKKAVKGGAKRLILHTDGASRGNPGDAGLGVLMEDESGHIVKKLARYLGHATNNQAEYAAMIAGLREASGLGAEELSIYADSELLVKQLNGQYRVKNPELQVMHAEAKSLIAGYRRVVIEYVPRAMNAEADALANEAIDKRLGPA